MGSDSALFLIEAFDLLSSTLIIGLLYGIAFSLYCLCAWSLCLRLQKLDKFRQAMLSLGYVSILFFCATIMLALDVRTAQLAYINHADFPGGPRAYELTSPFTNSYGIADNVVEDIIQVSTMAIQVWRLWLVWSGTRYAVAITILPMLLLLSYIVLDVVTAVVAFNLLIVNTFAMNAAYFAVESAFTFLVTALIAARLLFARRQHTKIMGMSEAASPYLSIIAMLVESYTLESVWSLAASISLGLHSPSRDMFVANDSIIKIIAYFLIVYRVETGRGWTRKTERKLTSLQWNHGAQTATEDEVSGIQSRLPATTSMMAVDSLPITRSVSAA